MAADQVRPPSGEAAPGSITGRLTDPRVRLRLAMAVARFGEWWTDGGDYIHFSAHAAEIYGIGARRAVKQGDVDAMIHAMDREPTLKIVADALEAHQDFDVEYRVHRPNDGKVVWVRGRGAAVYGDAGQPLGLLGVITDVTARKQAQDLERLRVEEVEHRAKNLLMVVQALIQLTPSGTHEDYVQALTGRVSALARTHSLLAQSDWTGVGLGDLVREELQAFRRSTDQRIDGPDVTISANAAQPLSMVLHELATNAAKYGALAQPDGALHVGWDVKDDGSVVLFWRESGCSGLTVDGDSGFGSTLLDRLAIQLGGSVARRWGGDGLTATVEIGADRIKGEPFKNAI